jgi:phosphotransferase system IIB component
MSHDTVEFYTDTRLLVRVNSSIVPLVGSMINIKKITYKVTSVTFAVDHADGVWPAMRCNIDLEEV